MDLRLFVVEPDSIRRRLICESVLNSPGISLTGSAASLLDETDAGALEADIFLVNAALLSDEHDALLRISQRQPGAHFVLIGPYPDLAALLSSSRVPLRGFLSFNHLSSEEFSQSIRVIAYGGAVIEPLSAQLLLDYLHALSRPWTELDYNPSSPLTQREHEVLDLVRKGLSNKEIARTMSISLGTVRAHLRNIFRKLDVTSRAGAAVSSLRAPVDGKGRLAG